MDKYVVKLYARAYRDLDDIYTYIAETLLEPDTALNMVDKLEEAIFSLDFSYVILSPQRNLPKGASSHGKYNTR